MNSGINSSEILRLKSDELKINEYSNEVDLALDEVRSVKKVSEIDFF